MSDHLIQYVSMPLVIWHDKRLNPTEKLILTDIIGLIKTGKCFKGNQGFSELVGLSKDRISRILSDLSDRGYIKITLDKNSPTNVQRRYISLSKKFRESILGGLAFEESSTKEEVGIGVHTNRGYRRTHQGGIGVHTKDKKSLEDSNVSKDTFVSSNNLFGNHIDITNKEQPKKKSKKQSVAHPCFSMIKDYWMNVHRVGDMWSAVNSVKTNSLIKKIENYLASKNWDSSPESVFNFFKIMMTNLSGLSDFLKFADLSVIDSKFMTIVEQINQSNNGQSRYQSEKSRNIAEGIAFFRNL